MCAVDLDRVVAVERHHGDAELEPVRALGERGERLESLSAPGWSFDHIEA